MSEIAAVLTFLGQVVTTTLDVSVHIFCTVLLMVSGFAVWRYDEISFLVDYRAKPWKSRCMASITLSLLDLIAFPGLMCGFLSPMRVIKTAKVFKRFWCNESTGIGDMFDLRLDAFGIFFMTIFDLICLPFGILTIASPFGRQVALFLVMTSIHRCGYYDEDESDATFISITFLYYGASTALDMFAFIFCTPFVMVAFSTWYNLYSWVGMLTGEEPIYLTVQTRTMSRKEYASLWNGYISKFRELFVSVTTLALLDIAVFFPFILAFVSPLRNQELRVLLFGAQPAVEPQQPQSLPQTEDEIANLDRIPVQIVTSPATAVPIPVVPNSRMVYNQIQDSLTLRLAIIHLGGLALADFIMYPMIVVLWMTRYRYPCISMVIDGANHWGNSELWLVVSQFFYLVMDIFVFSIPAALLFITRFRWGAVKEMLSTPNVLSTDTMELYLTITLQLTYLLIDLLTLPFLLLLIITYYRFESLVQPLLCHPDIWRRGLLINKVIFLNGMMVFHDMIFLLPSVLVNAAILSFHRLYCMYLALLEAQTRFIENRQRLTVMQENTPIFSLDALITLSEIDFEIRCVIWENAVSAFIDLPFVLMAFIVLPTLWRTSELMDAIFTEMNQDLRTAYYREERESAISMKHFRQIRKLILHQFGMLLLDFATLIPLLITLVTVYKLPQVVTDLIGLYLERGAIKGKPKHTTKRCQVVWKVNTDPVMTLTIERTSSEDDIFEPTAANGFQLQVMGNAIWEQTNKQLGSLITSVIKAFLPLKLAMNETVGIITGIDGEVREDGGQFTQIWIKLPLGKTLKRSTLLKKLKKFAPDTIISIQVGCIMPAISDSNSSEEIKAVPFTYLQMTVEQLISGLSAVDDEFEVPCYQEEVDYALFDNQPVVAKVDRFAPIVMSSFAVVLKDFAHVLLFLALLLFSPYRFIQGLIRMFSSDESLRRDIGKRMWLSLLEAEYHLLRLRAIFTPVLNERLKNVEDSFTYRSHTSFLDRRNRKGEDREFKRDCVYHLNRYRFQHKYILSHLKFFQNIDSSDHSNSLDKGDIHSLFECHDQMMNWFFARHQVWNYLNAYNLSGRNQVQPAHIHRTLVLSSMVCAEEHDYMVREMLTMREVIERVFLKKGFDSSNDTNVRNYATAVRTVLRGDADRADHEDGKSDDANHAITVNPPEATGREENTPKKKKSTLFSYCPKLSKHAQPIIRSQAQRMVSDWIGFFLLFILIVTVVRIIPLIRDLQRKSPHLTYKSLFLRHFSNILKDLYDIGSLLLAWFLLAVTIVCIPNYLEDFSGHWSSWYDASHCAWYHVEHALGSLWELFAMVTALKTYRILGKSVLYCLFLPGASIASILGSEPSSLSLRFTVGMIIFAAVMIGALIVSSINSLPDHAHAMNYSMIGVVVAAVTIPFIVMIIKLCHAESLAQDGEKTRQMKLSWSHLLGLILGPIECLLLSSVVLYFYWDLRDGQSGKDNLSYLLIWRHDGDESGSERITQTAVTLAGAFVLVWAVLIAIPLAQGGDDNYRRRDKIHAVLSQPAYRTLTHFLSSTIGIWIIATLMRPNSCFEVVNASMMSTSVDVDCGSTKTYRMGHAALAFLVYFILTTTLVQPSFYEPRVSTNLSGVQSLIKSSSVLEFHPLYSLQLRIIQTIICLICFGLVGHSRTVGTIILAIVLALASLAALLPVVSRHNLSNVPAITYIRTISYMAVAWTAIVCMVHINVPQTEQSDMVVFATEGTIYIGWGLLYIAVIVFTVWDENRRRTQWQQAMYDGGLLPALQHVVDLYDLVSTNFSLIRRKKSAQLSDRELKRVGNQIQVKCNYQLSSLMF